MPVRIKREKKRDRGAKKYLFAFAVFCSGTAFGAILMGLIHFLV